MEAFDLAVGLGSVRTGFLDRDSGGGEGVAPQVGAVAAAVVGEDSFNGDSLRGELGHGPFQHTDSGLGLLVGADLDVGDPGVVIDHGV